MFAKSKNLLNDFAIINDSYDDNLKISFLSKLNEVKFFFLSLPLLTLDKDRIFSISNGVDLPEATINLAGTVLLSVLFSILAGTFIYSSSSILQEFYLTLVSISLH